MKTKQKLLFTVFFFILQYISFAKPANDEPGEQGGNYQRENNVPNNACISHGQYLLIENNCREHSKLFSRNRHSQNAASSVSLTWPLRAGAGLTDCSYYYISAHVDQDTAATTFRDYNCGSIAYDGHKGTDIAIGPFPFLKMDNNEVEVVAAAAGTIVDKHDGEYDRNCVGVGSGLTANYIILQHSDGSHTLYWHMKSNSLTAKTNGQTVAAGEFLGVVGSSGSSSGCHLHFEVWSGSTSSTVVDPFSGSCNHLNATSWWAVQKQYTEPSVIKASVHTTDVTMPPCPQTETPNESQSYSIPFQGAGLSPGYAKFYIFMRNETSGTTVNMRILNPNSTVFNSWTHVCSNTYKFSYWNYSKLLPTIPGTYIFQAIYNSDTCTKQFTITTTTGVLEVSTDFTGIHVYPNPARSVATIALNQKPIHGELKIYNVLGQIRKTITNISGTEIQFDATGLTSGIYFIYLAEDNKIIDKGRFLIVD